MEIRLDGHKVFLAHNGKRADLARADRRVRTWRRYGSPDLAAAGAPLRLSRLERAGRGSAGAWPQRR